MLQPTILKLNYTYKKQDTGVWVLNTDDIPLDKTNVKDQQIVHLAAQSIGGNHKHPRIEWYIGIGDLMLYWLDENNKRFEHHLHPNGEILLVTIPPFLPHAVANRSTTERGVLLEWANDKMKDVEAVSVIKAADL